MLNVLNEALGYPTEGESWMKRLLIGGVLVFLGVLIVPALLVYGYLVRELRYVISGEAEPPAFNDWGELLVDGVKGFVVVLVYLIVPLAILGLSGGFRLFGSTMAPGSPGITVGQTSPFGMALFGIASLVAYYLVPAAVANLSVNGSVSSGFRLGYLSELLTSGTYVTAWLLALAASLVLGAVTAVLNATVVGAVLVPFLSFYVLVAVSHVFGEAYREVLGPGGGYLAGPAPESTGV